MNAYNIVLKIIKSSSWFDLILLMRSDLSLFGRLPSARLLRSWQLS
jgi:hypothetical protein